MSEDPKLEAVYYPGPIPANLASITMMGLVFDRIHFPHVHFPLDGYDAKLVAQEIERLKNLNSKRASTAHLIGMLNFLPAAKVLKNMCYFSGQEAEVLPEFEEETDQLVNALYDEIHGPRPEGWTPIFDRISVKGLPESEESIFYPGAYHYPAAALIYSAKHGIPLINDNPVLPVPALGGESAKNNAKLLSAVVAMECVSLMLPKVRPLQPEELVEFRAANLELVHPFRVALLGFAADLNTAISSAATSEEIYDAARFLVETKVAAQLFELREVINTPGSPWYHRAYDVAKKAPELVAGCLTLPPNVALAQILSAVAGILIDSRNQRAKNEKETKRSGLHYLLKLSDLRGDET